MNNGMDEYSFNNYPGMVEFSSNAPVDVEATLNSLLASSPPDPYDFSASLLSTSTLRSQIPPVPQHHQIRAFPPANVQVVHPPTALHTSSGNIPILPPPPASPAFVQPVHSFVTDPDATPPIPNTTQSQIDKRKRRRKDEIIPEEVCKGFDWSVYQAPQLNYAVYDAMTMHPMGDNLDILVYKSGANTHFSATEKAWICYRQNQFKIFCLLKMPQLAGPMTLRDGAMDVEIKLFYMKLYAVKSTPMGMTEEVQVGLYHAGKSRVKKEKTEISAVPFVDGRAECGNLQFERSNAAKGQQEYFHLVVTLYAKTHNAYYPVISRISPRIIVRSQHPGFYGPPSPTDQQPQVPITQPDIHASSTSNSNYTSSEDGTSPKIFDNDPSWQQAGPDAVFRMGKVGINTSEPTEALTVHGNALVTGNLYKPSDRRIKSDFVAVDGNEQLEHIRNLKIYDYKIKERSERGVIAQELQVVMETAVHEAGDVNINGVTVPNLLVVNERSLLYENIGATQQLDKHLEIEKSNIEHIDMRVDDLQRDVERDTTHLKNQIKSISDILFAEEAAKDANGKEEQVVFGVNLFRMGPARSFMVLGYFVPYLWLLGILYIFSSMNSRRILGRACIVKFVVWWVLKNFLFVRRGELLAMYTYWLIGVCLLVVNWRRNKKRIEAKRLGIDVQRSRPRSWKCWEWALLRRNVDNEEEGEHFIDRDHERD